MAIYPSIRLPFQTITSFKIKISSWNYVYMLVDTLRRLLLQKYEIEEPRLID